MSGDICTWPPIDGAVPGILIEADGVCKAYARVPALYPAGFSLPAGQGLALLGPNGSGKSTLLRLLAGATQPTAGLLHINGYSLPEQRHLARRSCILVGHNSYQYEDLTGIENLRYFVAMASVPAGDIVLAEALAAVGLDPANRDRVRSYSAGMKQRLSIARVLLTKPAVLLLDEPHASLDDSGQALVDGIVTRALASGRGAVIASHDRERALDLCDQVLVLDGGRVTFQGSADAWRERTPLWVVGGGQ